MKTADVISHAKRIISLVQSCPESVSEYRGIHAQACEFLAQTAGTKSSFYNAAVHSTGTPGYAKDCLVSTLTGYISYLESGLADGISPEKQGQLDVVSDLLDQAHSLLENDSVHGAAPAVLIGATLEEFLRTWFEENGLSLGNMKPSIDAYAKALREADVINKQDMKDITAWAGIRNHAAHGEWDLVADKQRIRLMLEGVNLFMRRYGG